VSKLLDLIRKQKAIRSGPDDFMVVHIQNICSNKPSHTRIGADMIEQAPGEPFDAFEARAIAAAKAAGHAVVSITLPAVDNPATAASEKIDAGFWEKHPDAMTDAELIATIASERAKGRRPDDGLHRITDDEIEAMAKLAAPSEGHNF
jgi:hypothetical protein